MPAKRLPQGFKSDLIAATRAKDAMPIRGVPPASALSATYSSQSTIQTREAVLTLIGNALETTCHAVVSLSDGTLSNQEIASGQDLIDSSLTEVARLCEGLPCFAAVDMFTKGVDCVDQRLLAEVYSAITLEGLGLSRGIRIRPTYHDIVKPRERALYDELEAMLESDLQPQGADQNAKASEKLAYIQSVAQVFTAALDVLARRNSAQGLLAFNPNIFSADHLAEAVNGVISDRRRLLTSGDIIALAGGWEDVAQFIEQLKAVMPISESIRILREACEKINEELSRLDALNRQLTKQHEPGSRAAGDDSMPTQAGEVLRALADNELVRQQRASVLVEQDRQDAQSAADLVR